MNRNSAEYKMWIRAVASAGCFIIAIGFFWAFNKTQVPYLLVGTGWFLRSMIHRTKEFPE